jgi:hypothetical protein
MSTDLKEENNILNPTLISILCAFSIALSFFFVLILNKKQSNYARIVRHIVMSEGIYIFCFFEMILRGSDSYFYSIKLFSKDIFQKLTFQIFSRTKTDTSLIIDKDQQTNIANKNDLTLDLMDVFNLAGYYSMEIFSLSLSIFICLELILILKNPIAQLKSRLKPYFIISAFLAILVFVMICTSDISNYDDNVSLEKFMFLDIFQL